MDEKVHRFALLERERGHDHRDHADHHVHRYAVREKEKERGRDKVREEERE